MRVAGAVFVVTFAASLAMLGDQAGAFADSEDAFDAIFVDATQRAAGLLGGILLITAAIAFGVLIERLTVASPRSGDDLAATLARVSGLLAAGAMVVAGAAFMTVPASLVLGDYFGDPGIETARPLLPHLGYALLVAGIAVPAAVALLAADAHTVRPRWFRWLTRVLAVLLVIAAPSVAGLILLPLWVLLLLYRPR